MKRGSRRSRGPPLANYCWEERVERGNPAPLGRASPGSRAPWFPGAARGTWSHASLQGWGWVGGRLPGERRVQESDGFQTSIAASSPFTAWFSAPEGTSRAPAPSARGLILKGRRVLRDQTVQGSAARRERILGTAGGSAGDLEPGAASQTGWGRSEPAGLGAHRRAPGEPGQQSG